MPLVELAVVVQEAVRGVQVDQGLQGGKVGHR